MTNTTTRPRVFAERTRVSVEKSRAEIERLLMRTRCQQYGTAIDYAARLARVQFTAHSRIVRFVVTLPDPARLRADAFEQAERRVWRSLLLVIKAKLTAVDSGITTFEEEFLAHIVLPNDRTVADTIAPHIAAAYTSGRMPRALLAPASEPDDDDAIEVRP